MGNIIGILSTVILVSTLATLIFAVIAYVMARRRRADIEEETGEGEERSRITPSPCMRPPESERPPPVQTAAPASGITAEAPAPMESAESGVPAAVPSPKASPDGRKETKPLFRQLTPHGEKPVDPTKGVGKDTGWDWE